MNFIKRTIEGIEKKHTEYKFHFNGDISAVVNVFQHFRFVQIRHYREDTYLLSGMCFHPAHFDDRVKLLGKTRRIHTNAWKYLGETIRKWSYR